MANADHHSTHSSLREKVLEHLFIGELLRCLWRRGMRDVAVLRPEVDRAGYDLVIECGGVLRHIQLKSSARTAKTSHVAIATALAGRPGACVVWLRFDPDTLELGPFHWYGGPAGALMQPLGDRVTRHTRANADAVKAERPGHRDVKRTAFTQLPTMEELLFRMFGPSSGSGPAAHGQ